MTFIDRPRRRLDLRLKSPAQLALLALGLWLFGAVVHPLAVLAPLGVILLVVAGVAYVLRPKRNTMYWRGRRIDLDDLPTAGRELYHLLFRH
jgi:hypothetical protein